MSTLADPTVPRGSHPAALVRAFAQPSADPVQDAVAAGRSAGYAAGWTLGLQQAQARGEAELEAARATLTRDAAAERTRLAQAVSALHQAAGTVRTQQTPMLEEIADLVLAAGVELAQSILAHEVAVSSTPGLDAVRRALRLVGDADAVSIRLDPASAAQIDPSALPDHCRVVADPTLRPGDSVAELATARIDLLLAGALERARDLLHGGTPAVGSES